MLMAHGGFCVAQLVGFSVGCCLTVFELRCLWILISFLSLPFPALASLAISVCL